MKTFNRTLKTLLSLVFFTVFTTICNGQLLKKLGKVAERAAERTVERRVDKETSKKTDQVLDSILEPGSKEKKENRTSKGTKKGMPTTETPEINGSNAENSPKSISVYSKFDFVPGDELLFFDDFNTDFPGDFPSKWDTNGSGEIVIVDGTSEKWFEIKAGSVYIPELTNFPEDYTIELDLLTLGLDNKTSSVSKLEINLTENNSYDWYKAGNNSVSIELPFCQYIDANIRVQNKIDGETLINNLVETDMRAVVLERPHISIAVNGQRFRLWVNEKKYVDVPRLVASGSILKYLRLAPDGLVDGKDRIFIKNLKVAKGGVDLRKKLMSEGSVSTNGILFDSGSDNLKPESMGIILQISQVLQQEKGMSLKIVGHTDADGADDANMKLSKARAESVKKALVSIYSIDSSRLSTEGKGETEPVSDNSSADGKAKNRRVEFIKQ